LRAVTRPRKSVGILSRPLSSIRVEELPLKTARLRPPGSIKSHFGPLNLKWAWHRCQSQTTDPKEFRSYLDLPRFVVYSLSQIFATTCRCVHSRPPEPWVSRVIASERSCFAPR